MKPIFYDIFEERWMTVLVNPEDESRARAKLDEAYDEWMNPEIVAAPDTEEYMFIHDSCCEEYIWERFQKSGIPAAYFESGYDYDDNLYEFSWYNPYGWDELINETVN